MARTAGLYINLGAVTASSTDMLVDARVPVEITSKLADVRLLQAASGAVVDVWYFG